MSQKGFSGILILIFILFIVSVGFGGFYYFKSFKQDKDLTESTRLEPVTQDESKTASNQSENITNIKIGYLKEGNLYIYQDGAEKLLVSPKSSDPTKINKFSYPIVSSNGRYLAYIDALTKKPHEDDFPDNNPVGKLKVINLENFQTTDTQHETGFYSWNSLDQLEFIVDKTILDENGALTGYNLFVQYDPASAKELSVNKLNFAKNITEGITSWPKNGKSIRSLNGDFYLVEAAKKETKLVGVKKFNEFVGWSTSGKYAAFYGYGGQSESYYSSYFVVNTENLDQPYSEIPLTSGGAGGELGTGLKWYFDQAFIPDCSEELSFLDGKKWELTKTGGGGCNNSEGFVSTSPNGESAIVKFNDRFELHTKNGQKTQITEQYPIMKSRFTPKNMIWIGNDFLAMFESTVDVRNIGESSNKIFLFDRKANTIKPIIDYGYLIQSAGVP